MACGEQIAGRVSESDPDHVCLMAAGHADSRHGAPLPDGRWARWETGLSDLEVERRVPDADVTGAARVKLRSTAERAQEEPQRWATEEEIREDIALNEQESRPVWP